MTRKDELISERDSLIWLLTHTATALTEAARDATLMSYNQHMAVKNRLTDEEGLEFAINHLKHKAKVGVSLLSGSLAS